MTCLKNLELVHMKYKRRKVMDTLTELEHEWFIGDSGTGKSSTARRENPGAYIKQCNKWWDGYKCEEVVIIDDLDTNHEYMAYFINQWADHYAFPAEIKGGTLMIRPKKLIITSRYSPDQIFKDVSTISSINRRFKFRHFESNLLSLTLNPPPFKGLEQAREASAATLERSDYLN